MLRGVVSNDLLKKELSYTDLFFFPSSKHESFGCSLIEEMAAGCIVFACKDAGATNFVVQDGLNGFAYKNLRDLKLKIMKYKSMNELDIEKMRQNAITTMKQNWDPTIIALKINNMLTGKNDTLIELR